MGIFKRNSVTEQRAEQRAAGQTSGLAVPAPWLSNALGAGLTSSAERVNPQAALRMLDVFAAVNIISELVGGLPLNTYRKIDDITLPANDHRAAALLGQRPNPFTPANRFWSTVTTHLLLYGNAFIEKLRDDTGLVNELRIVLPTHVQIDWDAVKGIKTFRVTRQYGQQEVLGDDRLLHIFGVSDDGLMGMSPITQARESLGIAKARDRFEADMYAAHPFISGTLTHPGTIKDGGVSLRESWRSMYASGSRDRHGVAVLQEGVTFSPIEAKLKDMQFIESAQLSKVEIAVLFKLPPSYLGGSVGESLTYQTVEGNQIQLAKMAIAPVAHNISTFLSQDTGIYPFSSWFCEFHLDELMRGDSAARAAYYTAMSAIGALTVEEIRQRENLPPLPEEQEIEAETQTDIDATEAPEDPTLPTEQVEPSEAVSVAPVPSQGKVSVPAHVRQLPQRKPKAA